MRDIAVWLEPSQAALLVIDMQNDFCHPDGGLAKAREIVPWYDTTSIEAIGPAIIRTAEAARRVGIPVICVRSEYSDWTTSGMWRHRGRGNPLDICRPGSWGAESFGFEPAAEDLVLVKHRYSPFVNTPLETVLRAQDVKTLVVAGTNTNVCIESTARDAFMRDFRVVVLSDCVATYDDETQRASLQTIDRHFGAVVDSPEVLRVWAAE
jgi:ureidoacrylate peracid hydrolase